MFLIIKNVYKNDKNIIKYLFILLLLQFFCLLVYLEIIELNFCGLNENIKRNIQIRAANEMALNESSDSFLRRLSIVEIDSEYTLNDPYGEKVFNDLNNQN